MELPSTLNDLLVGTGQERVLLDAIADQSRLRARIAELEKACREMQLTNKAQSESLTLIAHELRTPLSGVIGMTDLLRETEVSDEQREHLDTIGAAGRSMLQLLNDLLEYCKLEAGQLECEPVQFSMRMALHTIIQPLKYMASQKGLNLHYSVDFDVPDRLIGEPTRLGQILVNLIGNAIKFTECGEIAVNVERTDSAGGQVCVQFTVSDTGTGIAADKMGRIFEPYYQAGSRRRGGIGMGLAISARLAESLHGKIWVESEPGEGSSFHFTGEFGLMEPVIRAMGAAG
jgi:two-component system sensor histidine kinase/response regulator